MKIIAKTFSNRGHQKVDFLIRMTPAEIRVIYRLICGQKILVKRDGKEILKNARKSLTSGLSEVFKSKKRLPR